MSDADYNTITVHQLSGPGSGHLEDDPPVFHFDLTSSQLKEFTADPVAFLERIGLGPEQGVAVDGEVSLRFSEPRWLWNGSEWQDQRQLAPTETTTDDSTSCCFSSGPDEITIHTHTSSHYDLVYVEL